MYTTPSNGLPGSPSTTPSRYMNGFQPVPPPSSPSPKSPAQLALDTSGALRANIGTTKPLGERVTDLEALKQENAKLQGRFNIVSSAKNSLVAEKADLLARIAALEVAQPKSDVIANWEERIRRAELAAGESSTQLQELAQKNAKLDADNQRLKAIVASPVQPLSARGSQIGLRESQVSPSEAQKAEMLEKQLLGTRQAIAALNQQKDEAVAQSQVLIQKVEELERQLKGARMGRGVLEQGLQSPQISLQPIMDSMSTIAQRLEAIQHGVDTLQVQKKATATLAMRDLRDMLEVTTKQEEETAVAENIQLRAQLSAQTEELEALRERVTELKPPASVGPSEMASLKEQLERATRELEQEKTKAAETKQKLIESTRAREELVRSSKAAATSPRPPTLQRDPSSPSVQTPAVTTRNESSAVVLQRLTDRIEAEFKEKKLKFEESVKYFDKIKEQITISEREILEPSFIALLKADGFCQVWTTYTKNGEKYLSEAIAKEYAKYGRKYNPRSAPDDKKALNKQFLDWLEANYQPEKGIAGS